ncbi:MAG: formylglycine-generating enzyme family protein [Planctomycetia bacterium]|nr:formylglycine-generating enzyme family protein [Planctomycetia bacterium]
MVLRSLVIALFVVGPLSMAGASEPAVDELAIFTTFRQEFVPITPGKGRFPAEFEMGRTDGDPSERPPHKVAVDHAFAIARYEVPQNLWQAVMGANPSRWKGPRNSVEMLSYDEAMEFCHKVSERLRACTLIGPGQTVRLPSEAEWEYAARAGTSTRYSFGDDLVDLDAHAWHKGNAAGNDPPVGAKRPNAWNLYDVHGYLWEWCADAWHESYDGAPRDGAAWTAGGDVGRRVLRGGSWKDPPSKLTSSFRRAAPRELKDDAVGLRCVLADAPTR